MINQESYTEFLRCIQPQTMQPMSLSFNRTGDIPQGENQIQLSWKFLYANDDPLFPQTDLCVFRPKFEFVMIHNGTPVYNQTSLIVTKFTITNRDKFDDFWMTEEVRKFFRDKQIPSLLWPIVRQQVLDGFSRLGLPPISLPWMIN